MLKERSKVNRMRFKMPSRWVNREEEMQRAHLQRLRYSNQHLHRRSDCCYAFVLLYHADVHALEAHWRVDMRVECSWWGEFQSCLWKRGYMKRCPPFSSQSPQTAFDHRHNRLRRLWLYRMKICFLGHPPTALRPGRWREHRLTTNGQWREQRIGDALKMSSAH